MHTYVFVSGGKKCLFVAHVRVRIGVRNVRFSENLARFVFLKHSFWDSPFCLITDEMFLNKLQKEISKAYELRTYELQQKRNTITRKKHSKEYLETNSFEIFNLY